jgi:hypothetical protein
MSLDPGTRLGTYEIVGPLGVGGMGEVYRARDTRLERHVALKLVIEAFVADPDRAMRFEREAKTLAALNHPNIATLHGLEQAGGRHFLVMELVEGETLAERIARQPRGLPLEDALRIASQIAEALEAAHEKGIIHRDLKPANVKITPDDKVKVLDFGLARVTEREGTASSISLAHSPTFTSPAMTNAGVILGTASYMSPEQARGYAADHRSDIFSFGVVLYEMLTGRQPFPGDTISDVLASVLAREPDLAALPRDLSPRLIDLVKRCLEKNPKKRWQAIGDVRYELESLLANPRATAAAAPASPRSRARRIAPIAAAGLAGAIIAAAAAWLLLKKPEAARHPTRFRIETPFVSRTTVDRPLAISPDGRYIVHASISGSGTLLMLRSLDRLEETVVGGGTTGLSPFFSPDSKWLGFFTASGEIRKVAVAGGSATTIGRVTGIPRGAAWSEDGTIVFGSAVGADGIFQVPAAGGTPQNLLKPEAARGEIALRYPSFLPGGRRLIYTLVTPGVGPSGADYQLVAFDLATGQKKPLMNGSQATYVATGHLVYGHNGSLRAVPFDAKRLEMTGEPFEAVGRVGMYLTGGAAYAVSSNGTLIYMPGGAADFGAPRSLAWIDRTGREEPVGAPPRAYFSLRLSPDGTRVVLDVRDQDTDLWVWDIARRALSRLTFEIGPDIFPVWTRDGRAVVYRSAREGPHSLYRRPSDGTGSIEKLTSAKQIHSPTDVSPDGTRLIFTEISETQDVMMVPLDAAGGERPLTPLVQTRFHERNGIVSPDGRWLAYESDQSAQVQIYVRPFPDTSKGQWQVSPGRGSKPLWSRDGRELFYLDGDNVLMSVPIADGSEFQAGEPRKLFTASPVENLTNGLFYDVMPDGRRFIVIKEPVRQAVSAADAPHIVVVVDWFSELRGKK